ncbi:MAG: PilZ domain-containing protein [Desulfobacterales bacterium]|nr:MAG: PilZ domain-containing protein [Desulfobacterales bacterium]
MERRKYRRFKYEAIILHDLLAHQNIYDGKIANFSKAGLYFESDQTIQPGEEIFLKLTKPPNASGDDFLSQLPFVVKIVWQRKLQASTFRYGYGALYLDSRDALVKTIDPTEIEKAPIQNKNEADDEDPREHPRRAYNKPLVFDYNNRYYRSLVTNISRGGAFIRTRLKMSLGGKVIIVIPGSKIRKRSKLNGWIVRRNREGFAVKFDRRSGRKPSDQSDRRIRSDRRAGLDRRDRDKQERRGKHED